MKTKHCLSCGRPFTEQKRWEKNWDKIKYCSAKCRSNKWDRKFNDLEEFIIDHIKLSINEIEEKYFAQKKKDSHEIIKSFCRKLYEKEIIEIHQKGKPIASLNFKGSFEIKLKN